MVVRCLGHIWEMTLFSVLTAHSTLTTCVYQDLKDLLFCSGMGLLSSTKILLWPMMSRAEQCTVKYFLKFQVKGIFITISTFTSVHPSVRPSVPSHHTSDSCSCITKYSLVCVKSEKYAFLTFLRPTGVHEARKSWATYITVFRKAKPSYID